MENDTNDLYTNDHYKMCSKSLQHLIGNSRNAFEQSASIQTQAVTLLF